MTISYKNKLSELIPTYQSGIYLTCISESKAFLGNIYSSLEIFDQNLIQLLKCLDGINTLADIACGCNLPVDQLVQILEPFEKKKLIVFQATTQDVAITELIKSENLMQSELGEKILAKRIIGELDSVTLDRLYARSTFQIMIFGKNRLALNLLGLLQSIGFSRSIIIGSFTNSNKTISNSDICGASVRTLDHGLDLQIRQEQIINEQNLFKSDEQKFNNQMTKPDLILALEKVPADYQQRWMCESTPHLFVGPYLNGEIAVGPLVIPGKTPCLNCIDLNSRQFHSGFSEIATNCESEEKLIPSAQLWVLLGTLAIAISEWADRQTCSLISNQKILDFRDYAAGNTQAGSRESSYSGGSINSKDSSYSRGKTLYFNSMCGCRKIP